MAAASEHDYDPTTIRLKLKRTHPNASFHLGSFLPPSPSITSTSITSTSTSTSLDSTVSTSSTSTSASDATSTSTVLSTLDSTSTRPHRGHASKKSEDIPLLFKTSNPNRSYAMGDMKLRSSPGPSSNRTHHSTAIPPPPRSHGSGDGHGEAVEAVSDAVIDKAVSDEEAWNVLFSSSYSTTSRRLLNLSSGTSKKGDVDADDDGEGDGDVAGKESLNTLHSHLTGKGVNDRYAMGRMSVCDWPFAEGEAAKESGSGRKGEREEGRKEKEKVLREAVRVAFRGMMVRSGSLDDVRPEKEGPSGAGT